ncbi:hypothetical protein A3742_18215 [Oleiphilus sp. HI0071]|uniref:XdhC family protein n=4 Tax=unclassified Oleiphilus TaxID=2631174 RepID=UPI0007C39855|nr:XdhC family protein [Oleiphilus sp. HI0079]KZY62186.1 hypothetical protein A3737_04145 [Oleiphilus sp. HI0065]KZY82149.1 hypothetical protein A3742_10445 [Oleiphilus sp. HI0071]KZZ00810.1 hypothetical protein A3744_11760 [Oleiphilus sp. HI0073]KZZ48330.1 hypothetical protein A3760_15490 [Oleiphilus sp. HI0122]KZZ69454.1 hypothetical protein A3765_17430 [Oleiphilus sp. HI0130]KZZ79263.1 hypothetical protein A3767_11175 [Oleiphilus sp. HI0133]
MNTQRIEVFKALLTALQAKRPVFLVTVLETWGASPRPAGSVLAFDPLANQVFGSVSGGCVEEDLLESLRSPESLDEKDVFPITKRYGADAAGYDLPCGATIELLIELFDPVQNSSCVEHVQTLLARVDQLSEVCRCVALDSSRTCTLTDFPDEAYGEVWCQDDCVYLRCAAIDKLLLIGATDVAQYLVPLVQQLGYQVSICEPRRSFLERQSLLGNIDVITDALPDDVVYQSYFEENSAIVALAHDPRIDDLGVLAALQGRAHFVGALGSQRNAKLRRQRLMKLGLTENQIEKLKAPVGLSIGSHTPIEIAISIAAQLVDVRSLRVKRVVQGSLIGKIPAGIDKAIV